MVGYSIVFLCDALCDPLWFVDGLWAQGLSTS
jgi:hypothetical protein